MESGLLFDAIAEEVCSTWAVPSCSQGRAWHLEVLTRTRLAGFSSPQHLPVFSLGKGDCLVL